jgi:hypothetical protein
MEVTGKGDLADARLCSFSRYAGNLEITSIADLEIGATG